MCKIIRIRYISPDGRRRNTERKELCHRSDGINPCIYQEVETQTEVVSSGTPSLVGDEVSTPASASIPGTPLTATANYEYREPFGHGEASSSSKKGKAKSFGVFLDIGGGKGKKSSEPSSPKRKRRSGHSSYSGSSNGDTDSIIAIEEDGHISPSRRTSFSLSAPFSMRRPREQQAPLVNQPQPPQPGLSMRSPTSTSASFHRRTFTEPEPTVRFSVDNEVTDRANAREALRRENRDRERAREAEGRQRLRQELEDRRLAESLQEKEKREKAADDFSMREYERLQEKDRLRREKAERELAHKEKATQHEIETLEAEIQAMKTAEDIRQRAREETQRRRAEARSEAKLHADLDRIRAQRAQADAAHLADIQAEIDAIEAELLKQQERRQARERAEQLEQEIRHSEVLAEEIRELEAEQDRDEKLRRIEMQLHADAAFDRQRYVSPPPLPLPLPRIPPPAPMPPTTLTHRVPSPRTSALYDEEYRRAVGERVVQQERDLASARALQAPPPQRLLMPGVGRRNTVGGRERERERAYRELRRRYPE